MTISPRKIAAIVKKALIGLLPLVLLGIAVFTVEPIIASPDLRNASEFWVSLQANFSWLGYLIAILLMISVLQLDPVSSQTHDWLTRPALGIFALPGSPDALMEAWYDREDRSVQEKVAELYRLERQTKEEQIRRFETELPGAQAVVLENADHWVFLSHEQEVLAAILAFIEGL
jgi:pimeloyl-ACP methyl ester carboxylesterase